MKNVSIVVIVLITVLLLSCSDDNQNVVSTGQKTLSLVIPQISSGSASGNLLLLKDGRTANPVSGIPNFSTVKVGEKLSISYRTGSVHNGIVDIDVTQFSSAKDSTFIPSPTSADTTSLTGTFTGPIYKTVPTAGGTSNGVDTVRTLKTVSITFNKTNTYVCSGVANEYPAAGSGSFAISHGTFSWYGTVTFTDNQTNSDLVLNGQFSYFITNQNLLCLYATRNGIYYSFYLKRG